MLDKKVDMNSEPHSDYFRGAITYRFHERRKISYTYLAVTKICLTFAVKMLPIRCNATFLNISRTSVQFHTMEIRLIHAMLR